jgi:putative ABC transport system permease protein
MKFVELIVRSMMRRRRRTLLTGLTIAVATLVFAMLVAVPASMDHIIESAVRGQRLYITNRAGPYGVPAKYCRDIRQMPHVTGCAAQWDLYMLYQGESDWIGLTAADLEIVDITPDYPRLPREAGQFRREKRSALVGSQLMKKNGWRVGQQITLRRPGGLTMPFIVLAEIPSNRYPNAFVMRRDYLEDSLKAGGQGPLGFAARLMIRVDSADETGPVARAIDERYRNSEAETRSQTESDTLANGLSNIGNIRAIIFSLVVVVLLTVLLISGNSTAMSLRDRIPEIALLRTLGYSRGIIAYLLFGEAAFLGIVGGTVGAIAALALFAGGVDMGTITSGLGLITVSIAVATLSLAVAVIVSIVSGTLPISGALNTPPAIALRKVV